MRPALVLISALLLQVASSFAQAPDADIAYCSRLADLYDRYLGQSDNSPQRDNSANSLQGQVASTQCREGRPGPAIPVLERILRGNGFTLPPRA